MTTWFRLATLLALAPSIGAGQETVPSVARTHSSFWQAAGGVLAANGLTWGYNWYVQRWHWANVGTRSWAANLRDGFMWDDDCFVDNQLAHPYHGSFYHSSARASGYGYWSSLPYVVAGSASWELFFENVRPSLNDFVSTTLGGSALGEVTFRLSSLLVSRRYRGGAALGREIGAFALSPIARAHTLLLGAGAIQSLEPTPTHSAWVSVGSVHDPGTPAIGLASRGFAELAIEYGTPFDENAIRPYDAFEFRIRLTRDAAMPVDRVEVAGLLARHLVHRSATSQVALGLFQHYDYLDTAPFDFAGQSLSGAWLYTRRLSPRVQLNLDARLETLLLGALSSDHGHFFRRDYDYGPGAGGRLSGSLRRNQRKLLQFEHRILWLHSLHGAPANHLVTAARVGAVLPLARVVQLGGDYGLLTRHSSYRGFPRVTRQAREMRAYLILSLN
jgi:Domain of unknown function (DUF3943)